MVPLLKDTLWRQRPSRKDTNSWQQVLWLHVILLTKWHLSNKDKFLAEGRAVSLLGGGLLYMYRSNPVIRTPLLPHNSVDMKGCIKYILDTCCEGFCLLCGVSSLEGPLRKQPLCAVCHVYQTLSYFGLIRPVLFPSMLVICNQNYIKHEGWLKKNRLLSGDVHCTCTPSQYNCHVTTATAVKPVLKYHCHEKAPVVKDHNDIPG